MRAATSAGDVSLVSGIAANTYAPTRRERTREGWRTRPILRTPRTPREGGGDDEVRGPVGGGRRPGRRRSRPSEKFQPPPPTARATSPPETTSRTASLRGEREETEPRRTRVKLPVAVAGDDVLMRAAFRARRGRGAPGNSPREASRGRPLIPRGGQKCLERRRVRLEVELVERRRRRRRRPRDGVLRPRVAPRRTPRVFLRPLASVPAAVPTRHRPGSSAPPAAQKSRTTRRGTRGTSRRPRTSPWLVPRRR